VTAIKIGVLPPAQRPLTLAKLSVLSRPRSKHRSLRGFYSGAVYAFKAQSMLVGWLNKAPLTGSNS